MKLLPACPSPAPDGPAGAAALDPGCLSLGFYPASFIVGSNRGKQQSALVVNTFKSAIQIIKHKSGSWNSLFVVVTMNIANIS